MKEHTPTILSRIYVILEVLFVLSMGFGLFIFSSTRTAFFSSSISTKTQSYSSFDFFFIVIYELIALFIIAYFLKYRRWILKDFNLNISLYMFGIGLVLAILRIGSGIGIKHLIDSCNLVDQTTFESPNISIQSNLFSIILIVFVNSFFEEFLLIGYLFKRFEKLQPAAIILLSSIVRISFHTYQGWQNLISVFIMALIFGYYYTKEKKLWPIIIAHAIGNAFYFLNDNYNWINT